MNVKDFSKDTKGTLGHYFAAAIGLTAATIWIIIAFQSQYLLPPTFSFPMRLAWPILLPMKWLGWTKLETEDEASRKKKGITGEDSADVNASEGHNHPDGATPLAILH